MSYQTIQYTAHQRSQINALSFDTSWRSWKFEIWIQIYQKGKSGTTARSSWQPYSQITFSVFSKRNLFTYHNTMVCIVAPLLMWYGVTNILDKTNQSKTWFSNFFIFMEEIYHFTTSWQYQLTAKNYIQQISIRALILRNILIFFSYIWLL